MFYSIHTFLHSLPFRVYYIAALVTSAAISIYAIRKLLFITRKRKLYDIPDDTRKIHGAEIPTLGGIGIFIGYVITIAFSWPDPHSFMSFILGSTVILFFTGIYDDIMNMRPSKKLIAQLAASLLTIVFAQVRLENMYGLFGIGAIPYLPAVIITTLVCTFFINVFNFIDGIDGLAGVLAVLYMGILGLIFAQTYHYHMAGTSFALAGATIGLLYYNISPAKIYMGDTGSMFLGFTIFIFSVLFINWCGGEDLARISGYIHTPQNGVIIILSMLFLPIFDAIRVFILRASKGRSPLKADRTHLHYYLLDAGFSHTQSVIIIVSTNLLLIILAFVLQDISPYITLLIITVLTSIMMFIVYMLRGRNLAQVKAKI